MKRKKLRIKIGEKYNKGKMKKKTAKVKMRKCH